MTAKADSCKSSELRTSDYRCTSMDSHDACAKKIKGRALKLATIIVQ